MLDIQPLEKHEGSEEKQAGLGSLPSQPSGRSEGEREGPVKNAPLPPPGQERQVKSAPLNPPGPPDLLELEDEDEETFNCVLPSPLDWFHYP